MSRNIAFFDFDGTITHKDTLIEFLLFTKGTFMFWVGMFLCSPWILAWKAKVISNQTAKEKVIAYFFRGTKQDEFENLCLAFYNKRMPLLIRKEALAEILQLQQLGFITVIVSASPGNWIKPLALEYNMSLISTDLEIENGIITGKIKGLNCYGEEKVRRIKERYDLNTFNLIYAYGDSSGDIPMLNLAGKAFMKPFRD